MMDWSDKHCRFLWRLISKHCRLYTEMITAEALLHGERERFLDYNPEEHPLALQLGGSDPRTLAQCAKFAEAWGYDEVNLNCGCPSDRVQNHMIGACLMAHPQLVSDCIKAMQDVVSIPVTVKHRIGIDDMNDYLDLNHFVDTIAATGCQTFIVHARKAWLQGLSPKENRELPPLLYNHVHQLKREHPELTIVINGGLRTLEQCQQQLRHIDGVMLGREAYSNPYLLAGVDQVLYGESGDVPNRQSIMAKYIEYCAKEMDKGTKLHHMSRHVLGLFQGQQGARLFRRHISENAYHKGAGIAVLEQAFNKILTR